MYFAVNENDFAVVKCILPWTKRILPWWSIYYREWKRILLWVNWFCRGEIDFAVSKKALPWQLWSTKRTPISSTVTVFNILGYLLNCEKMKFNRRPQSFDPVWLSLTMALKTTTTVGRNHSTKSISTPIKAIHHDIFPGLYLNAAPNRCDPPNNFY